MTVKYTIEFSPPNIIKSSAVAGEYVSTFNRSNIDEKAIIAKVITTILATNQATETTKQKRTTIQVGLLS